MNNNILPFNTVYIHMLVVAVFYGLYPLIVREVNTNGTASALVLAVAAIVPLTFRAWILGEILRPNAVDLVIFSVACIIAGTMLYRMIGAELNKNELILLLAAGILMGIGFSSIIDVSLSKAVNISISMPIIDTIMLTILVMGGIYYFKEELVLRQVVGLLGVPFIIFLIRPT